jgi:SH3-like domain-containing protein
MFGTLFSMPDFFRSQHQPRQRKLRALLLSLLAVSPLLSAPVVLAADTPSGLPLPRFATTRNTPINVRVGPGERYSVAWIYVKAGTPVEIVQEFDTWRKIRDADGSEGWIHQNLLSGKRAGLTRVTDESKQLALLANRNGDSNVRAWLGPNYRVDIKECDGAWCEVNATYQPSQGNSSTYSGFLPQTSLWGVYQGEAFD